MIIEQRYMGTSKYYFEHEVSAWTSIRNFFVGSLFIAPFMCGVILVPKTAKPHYYMVGMKYIFPMTIGNLIMYGLTKYVLSHLGLCKNRKATDYDDIVYFD